jgi:hypothetical protein
MTATSPTRPATQGVARPTATADERPRARDAGALPRIVYILGAGRSGTTVLGILLGNLPTVFYGGELVAWNRLAGQPVSDRPDTVELWEAVAALVPDRRRHHAVDYWALLEHHAALLRPRRLRDPVLRRRHEEVNLELFRALRTVTGCEVLVDSSHYPLRAWRLRRMSGLDVRIVHMVRDPRRVIDALQNPEQRRVPMHPAQANLYCLTVALLSRIVLLRVPREHRITVRHEDLTSDPQGVLERVARFVGADPSHTDVDDLEVGPLFLGNRLRHQERLAIGERAPQPSRLSTTWRIVTAVVQVPLLVGYGYLPRRAHPARRRRRA